MAVTLMTMMITTMMTPFMMMMTTRRLRGDEQKRQRTLSPLLPPKPQHHCPRQSRRPEAKYGRGQKHWALGRILTKLGSRTFLGKIWRGRKEEGWRPPERWRRYRRACATQLLVQLLSSVTETTFKQKSRPPSCSIPSQRTGSSFPHWWTRHFKISTASLVLYILYLVAFLCRAKCPAPRHVGTCWDHGWRTQFQNCSQQWGATWRSFRLLLQFFRGQVCKKYSR